MSVRATIDGVRVGGEWWWKSGGGGGEEVRSGRWFATGLARRFGWFHALELAAALRKS